MIKVLFNFFIIGLMRLDDVIGFLGYEILERRYLVFWNRVILDKIFVLKGGICGNKVIMIC